MKKITIFVVFALMLAQVAGVAHAFADSFHSEKTHNVVISFDFSNLANSNSDILDSSDISNITAEHENCYQSCHGHGHFYLDGQIVNSLIIPKDTLLNSKNYLFSSLVHTPDSPPPNFS